MTEKSNNRAAQKAVVEASGLHILLELSECNRAKLEDIEGARGALIEAARLSKATVIDVSLHRFAPHGFSGVAVIAESHISVHTWPELNYAAIDIYTCGSEALPMEGSAYLKSYFEAKVGFSSIIKRGILKNGEYVHTQGQPTY